MENTPWLELEHPAPPTPKQLVLASPQPVMVLKRAPKQRERKNCPKGQDSQPSVTAPESVPDQRELNIRKKRRLKRRVIHSDEEESSTTNSSEVPVITSLPTSTSEAITAEQLSTATTETPGNPTSAATAGATKDQREEEETLDPPEEQSSRAEAELQEFIEQQGQKVEDNRFLPIT